MASPLRVQEHVNETGHKFYTYSLPGACPTDKDDNNDGEGNLNWQLSNLGISDASARAAHSRTHHHSQSASHGNSASQWELDNLPKDRISLSSDEDSEGSHIVAASYDVVLQNAYDELRLPIFDDISKVQAQFLMLEAALQFAFGSLEFLHDFRADMTSLRATYDDCVPELATDFYAKYGIVIWGSSASDDGEQLASLEKFFTVLHEHDATRSETGDDPTTAVKQLGRLRRNNIKLVSEEEPHAYLSAVYLSLEVQISDSWVVRLFQYAVAQMTFEALERVYDNVKSFPFSRPSEMLIKGVAKRILYRYASKLWPNRIAQPDDVMEILHRYILALLNVTLTREKVGDDAMRMLDNLVKLDDGDAEEESNRKLDTPEKESADFRCTLILVAEFKSCFDAFESAFELAAHMVEVHDWDQETADEIAGLV